MMRWFRGHCGPIGVGVVWAALAAANAVWLSLDHGYLYYDPAAHVLDAVRVIQDPAKSRLLDATAQWPPLVTALAAPIFWSTGYALDTTILVFGSAVLGVLLLSVYRLGVLLGDGEAGLVAVALTAGMPCVFGASRMFMLDLPLAAAAAAACALLFDERPLSVQRIAATGLVLALGLLVKTSFWFFVAGPGVLELVSALRRGDRTRARGLAFAGALGIGLALLWYGPRLRWFLDGYGKVVAAGSVFWFDPGEYPVSSPVSLIFYLVSIRQNGSLLVLLLGVAVLPAFLRAGRARTRLVSVLLPAYLVLTLLPSKSTRFGLPLAPFWAVLVALGLRELRQRWPTRWSMAAASVFLAVQLHAVSFGIPQLPRGDTVEQVVTGRERMQLWSQAYACAPQPDRVDWGVSEWFRELAEHARRVGPGPVHVGVLGHALLYDMLMLEQVLAEARGGPHAEVVFVRTASVSDLERFPLAVAQVGGMGGPQPEWQRDDVRAWLSRPGARHVVVATRHLRWHAFADTPLWTLQRVGNLAP